MSPATTNILELELPVLEELLRERGAQSFHARQIFRWVHRRGANSFEDMTDLSLALRSRLADSLAIDNATIADRCTSADGTTKFRLQLADATSIESVYIPDSPGMTICISTQVGCAMACAFCLTGTMGLTRNLSAGEIVGQVRVVATALGILDERFNIVLMGMGEPLHNYDNTMQALRVLTDANGLAMSPRRITLSTIGLVPAIDRLAAEPLMPNLAVSLHGTTEEQRDALVPVNRKYGLHEVLDACRRFPLKRRRRITFEYVLLEGINDRTEDAHRLARLLKDLKAKVNLLPLNEAADIPFTRPSDERVDRFAAVLARHHLTVSVRKSRGRDIRAACGQLAVTQEGEAG